MRPWKRAVFRRISQDCEKRLLSLGHVCPSVGPDGSTQLPPRHKLGVGGQHHAPAALPPGKRPGTHCIGG
jgi:hypothetical protein